MPATAAKTTQAKTPAERAAGFVAKAMIHTHPAERAALLVALIQCAAKGYRIITSEAEAAETLYREADAMAERAKPEAARG